MENEGYQGRIDHPARANHRIIRLDLLGQEWGFQYSPYAYFNEHCIFLDHQHVPMQITQETFAQLLEIVDQFPGYLCWVKLGPAHCRRFYPDPQSLSGRSSCLSYGKGWT
ncbi:galactose-1-phosphate uridylyltransferase [Streptococcus sobrinus DSM 20742 = ATCC 33478]|nr:galactose-1-phosphate uridylyltransferase [Streptococcus sobrinus DSM 20742 = ATCC 33478]